MTRPVTMQELMSVLKPVRTCEFLDLCAAYKREIEQAFADGESHYEISGLNTKSGHPHVVIFTGGDND